MYDQDPPDTLFCHAPILLFFFVYVLNCGQRISIKTFLVGMCQRLKTWQICLLGDRYV